MSDTARSAEPAVRTLAEVLDLAELRQALEAEVAARRDLEAKLQQRERELEGFLSLRTRSEEAQTRLAAIVESSDDAIVGKTLAGVITSWNHGAERIFGYTALEAVGRDITLIIPVERHHEEREVLARLRRGERIDHFETVRQTKDGRRLDISLTVSPIRNSAGQIIGASKVARDITEKKRAEAERQMLLERAQQAREQAERALQMRDDFLATVSHELRSPLNAIVGWTHLLRAGGLDADGTRRAVDTISRNATMQNQLISDILDVQRLSSGKLRLEIRPDADLALAVEAALDTVRPAAQAKGIALIPDLEDVGLVPGDPDRIQQIVWNLLSNAVKFTPAGGGVRVVLRGTSSHIDLEVVDDGPGIKPEFLPYVFERFRQDPADGRRKGGLGLGLAIVRNLAELHGGIVTAANREPGPGAIFTVRLPRAAGSAHIEAVRASSKTALDDPLWTDAPSLHGTRVMVVDDEPEAREVLAAVLGRCGADVTVATSSADALALLARDRPDVLLCDINMPDTDGYALLSSLRARPESEGGRVPAVALTAASTTEDRLRALRAGFQFHVPKPVQPSELATVIAALTRPASR
jgi:PAS domain S-box-containing protein